MREGFTHRSYKAPRLDLNDHDLEPVGCTEALELEEVRLEGAPSDGLAPLPRNVLLRDVWRCHHPRTEKYGEFLVVTELDEILEDAFKSLEVPPEEERRRRPLLAQQSRYAVLHILPSLSVPHHAICMVVEGFRLRRFPLQAVLKVESWFGLKVDVAGDVEGGKFPRLIEVTGRFADGEGGEVEGHG